jgi:hypothetical protein
MEGIMMEKMKLVLSWLFWFCMCIGGRDTFLCLGIDIDGSCSSCGGHVLFQGKVSVRRCQLPWNEEETEHTHTLKQARRHNFYKLHQEEIGNVYECLSLCRCCLYKDALAEGKN